MSFVIVESLADSPLTPEQPTETDFRVLSCLSERNATWQYSLLSSDRLRMLCIFDAPDAESVRESYRKGGGTFQQIWAGELLQPKSHQPQRHLSRLTVTEATYPPIEQQAWHEAVAKVLNCYSERDIEWVQSYLSRNYTQGGTASQRTRLICELNAPDTESVREARHRSGSPCERVWSAIFIQP